MALVLANIAKDLGDVSSLWRRIGEGLLDSDGFFDGRGGQTRIFATLPSATLPSATLSSAMRSARLPGPDRTKPRLSSTTPKETPPEERPAPPIIRLDATGRIWPSCSRKNGWEPSLTGMRGGCEPHEAPPRTGRSPWWWQQGSRLPLEGSLQPGGWERPSSLNQASLAEVCLVRVAWRGPFSASEMLAAT